MNFAILSRGPNNYSTQRLIEAAEQQGHEARIINHARCYVHVERSKPTIHYEGESLTGIDAVIPRIGQSITSHGAAVIRQFEMMKVYTSVSSLALVRSRDKLRSLQLLARAGVGIPNTVFARQGANVKDLIQMVGGVPVVVKLLEGTQGIGVVLAETTKAAESVIDAFYGLKATFVIQEFIEEAGGSDIRALVVGGKVVAAMLRQGAEGDFRSNLHRGGKSKKVDLTDKEKNLAVKAAETLGLAIAGVDMVKSQRGLLVLEVNSSPGLKGIEKATDVDIAGIIIEHAAKEAISSRKHRDKIGA